MVKKKKIVKKQKLPPEIKAEKEKKFDEVSGKLKPDYPSPSEEDLKHIGVDEKKKTRHRRTRAEIQAEKNKLAEASNPLLSPILKFFFSAWARGVEDSRIELTDQEADSMALPITQLMEYYLPQMPAIWFAWANLGIQVTTIMSVRFNIVKELRAKNANAIPGEKGNSGFGKTRNRQKFPPKITPQKV